jgi:EmrB/QacA subfamily drug resistance transporter
VNRLNWFTGGYPIVLIAEPTATLPPLRKRFVLLITCMSTLLINLDNTIVNVALPDIQATLHPSVSGLQWVADSYLMTLAALLVLSGSMGDRFGRRRVFTIGLVLFAAGSLLSSLAMGTVSLVAFRVIQAVGASMLNPAAMSIISNIFVDHLARAKAFAVWGGAVGLGMASGPVVGGLLVQAWGWRSVFLTVVPLAVAVAVAARALVPESRSSVYRAADLLGQVLVLALFTAVIFSIIELPRLGICSQTITASLTITIIVAIALGVVETHRPDPLIDFRFFRSIPFSLSMLIAILAYAAIGGFLFLNTIYLQDVRGYGPLRAGLYLLPTALGTVAGAQAASWLVKARGALLALTTAGLSTAVGGLLIAGVIGTNASIPLLVGYALLGLGFGGANTPVNNTTMAGMPRNQAGIAGALVASSRQLGQSLGVAGLGAVANSGAGIELAATFRYASQPGWYIISVVGLVIVVLGVLATRK